ncbi:T9SS type A sorting domain-containing protein [Portibacter marinus]|uniref:T9SS type A sorting domain-containing protein n=1 Tax=Portibacter marinus TaxID=2898660 RepID=UPI001F3B9F81|nr:T9SS type A sorting domain-containing protein [Portibacter marinus]
MNRKFTLKAFSLSLLTAFLTIFSFSSSNAQCELICIGQLNASIDTAGCAAVITVDMALNAIDDPTTCPDLAIEIVGQNDASIRVVGTYEYKVVNTANGNACWGEVIVEDKTAPILECPRDITISCADDDDPANVARILKVQDAAPGNGSEFAVLSLPYNGPENAAAWCVGVVECSKYNLEFVDRFVNGECDGDTIYRTFRATDEFGNITRCTQRIYLEPQDLEDISLPADYDCVDGQTGIFRYDVDRELGESGRVTGYIETDGTIGSLLANNIVAFDLTLKAGNEVTTLIGPDFFTTGVLIEGDDFIADETNLYFNYRENSGSYVDFDGIDGYYTNENDLNVLFAAMSETVIVGNEQVTVERSGMAIIGNCGYETCDDRIEPYGNVERLAPLNCDGAGTDWAVLPNGNPAPDDKITPEGDIIPGTGRVGGINCGTIQAGYTDIVVPICEEPGMECAQNSPSFKVVRQWKILDWCTGAIIEHNQIIKVMDKEPPVIEELPDVTITTTLWDCSASLELPVGESSDNCSEDIRVAYSSTAGSIVDGVLYLEDNAKTMIGGDTVQVMVDYYDCCGNTTSDTFAVVVQDLIPPVVVADLHTTVALSRFEEDGLAKIYAETFDDGSFDNCGPLSYGVRRMDGVCSGFRGEDKDGEFFEFIHFCCKDIGEPVMVEFRVCDDADMDGLAGGILGRIGPTEAEDVDFENDPDDNCNYAMIEVEVQDKLPPACSAPSDITIDCIDFAALGDIDRIREGDYDDIFGEAAGAAICDVDIEQELTSTEDCGLGEIVRTIKVTNENNGISATCFQVITVVVADSSENFLVCSDINFPPNSVERQTFDAAGYDNVWCETNPFNIGDPADDGEDLPAIDVMDCEGVNITAPIIDIDNLCSEVGINLTLDTFDFGGSACKKILAHWEVIDQCLFDENFFIDGEVDPYRPENGYFELYVEYDLFDTEGPVIECGDGFNAECDGSLAGQLSASATDNCTEPEFFGWNWRLDVGADGTVEFEGEGNTIEPEDIGMESFPEGQHIVTWIVSDGCGNLSSMDCPLGFEVVDSKEPTPYCYDGLATALMEMGGVTLWAADFDAGSFDNCGEVFVTIVPESDVEGLSDAEAYAASLNLVRNIETGKDEYGWTFGCEYIPNGVSNIIDVRLYATDEAGNFDYCTASLRLQDNLGACEDDEDGSATLGGNIATRDDQMVSEVEVEAMASNPEFPKYTSTDAEGNYAFYNNKLGLDYEITPGKTGDYRNGVTTLDLVLVQKHILGLEELSSMYQLIAADVNNDRQIKASDLLQLRKLILGVYPEDKLPSNDSWRFMSKQDDPEDKTQPWPFEEVANIQNLSSDMMSADFVAIKVGDVNGTVSVSEKGTAQVRNARAINLEIVEQRYAPGEEVKVAFTSADFKEVYGYQFTLAFGKDLDFVGFESGSLELSEANFGWNRLSEGLISTSYDNVKGVSTMAEEVLFTMIFKAKEVGTTASSIQINSRVTKAESYIGNGLEITDIQLRTNTDQKEAGFVLYQNEPNPFKQLTNISFNLPEAGNASLRVYDVTGKTLYSQSGTYAKGLNTIQVKNLGSTGVMYYQIESGEYTATKKMIVIE